MYVYFEISKENNKYYLDNEIDITSLINNIDMEIVGRGNVFTALVDIEYQPKEEATRTCPEYPSFVIIKKVEFLVDFSTEVSKVIIDYIQEKYPDDICKKIEEGFNDD